MHAQPRQDWHTQWSLGHSYGLFERAACLFPLLQSVIDAAQDREKALKDYPQRKGPSQRQGVLREHKRLFIRPLFWLHGVSAENIGGLALQLGGPAR